MTARRIVHWQDAFLLGAKALRNGALQKSLTRIVWTISGDCQNPFLTEVIGRPSARPTAEGNDRLWQWQPGRRHIIIVEIWTRCRKCPHCCRANARLWAARISYETENSPRTWFGTLTLNPLWHLRCEVQGRKDDVSPLVVSGQEVTRYLKRLRHHATAKLRYVCVTELHKSGKPHYHMLVHEQTRGALLHRVLADQWTWGFERWRVVDPQTQPAWYLCKYLMKENVDRVRASVLYGGRQKDDRSHL